MKSNSKLCTVLLTFTVFLSMLSITASAQSTMFTDVAAGDYFYPAVLWGVESGITQGVGDNLFDPNGSVTRAQVVTFLWRMAGMPEPAVTETFFDVEPGSWYETAVRWAVENGITKGTGDHMFSPDAVCDRAMCITLLYRLMDSPFDGIDLMADIELGENATLEDLGFSFVQGMVKGIREQGMLSDVPEGSYFELPVFWGLLNGIITEDNSGITEENTLFRSYEPCVRKEMISFLYQTKLLEDAANAPVEIYFGDDLALPIPQAYYNNEVLAMEIYGFNRDDEEDSEDELAIIISESASKDAAEALGEDAAGQGELFRIIRVSESRLHELLCGDMSGMKVFAKDEKDRYYIICYPTDVRYVRETIDKMNEDIQQWTELNEWARDNLGSKIIQHSKGLSPISFTNTMLDMYLARIAFAKDVKYTISTTAYGPLEPGKFDAAKYAKYLLSGNFYEAENIEAPDGEYVVLNFPDEGVRYDFFTADRNLVREVRDDYEIMYRRVLEGSVTNTEAMEGWYLAIAEQSGKKEDYKELDPFLGDWAEEIAGRGFMTITKSVAPAKADIEARWPGSAFEVSTWSITANLSYDGKLVYDKCKHIVTKYDENGNGTVVSEVTDEGGFISLDNEGKIVWKIDTWDEESKFIKQ